MKRDVALQQQVFLLENDSGLLCRILGLYAARALVIDCADYGHATAQTMMLTVNTACHSDADIETLRVLVEKAASFVGVIEAGERW